MNWILDANTIIYLIKAKLSDIFMECAGNRVIIDTNVYKEVVEKGEERGYQDATLAKRYLQKYQISIKPIDISYKLALFRDAGETSCHILSTGSDICISSDKRAIQKFIEYNTNVIHLDEFFFIQAIGKKLSKDDFISILNQLEMVYATSPERKLILLQELEKNE